MLDIILYKFLLLTDCEVRTIIYEPNIFSILMAQVQLQSAWAIGRASGIVQWCNSA